MLPIEKSIAWVEKNRPLLVWGAILLVSTVMICGVAVKYIHLGYNAMDLGIYNQVFYNTAHGRLFEFSVHPHSYLGDHFELFILGLSFLYAIYQSPITLLILQVLALTVAAWPLYLIAKKILPGAFPWLAALAWLINPFMWNMAFFEFHILPFAVILILFAYYFYEQKKFWPFVLCSFLAMTVREDVALVIIMFGFLSLIQRRSWPWVLLPIISGGLWFIAAMQLTGYFNMYGSYKFLSMYPWLGATLAGALKTILIKPWLVITHLITFKNLLLAIGLLLPLAALPILKPKTLILGALIAVQLFLSSFSPTVVLETHYTALILPLLFISAISGLSYLVANPTPENRKKPFILRYRGLYGIIIASAIIYSFIIISPIAALGRSIFSDAWNENSIKTKKAAAQQISPRDAVAAGYDFLAPLSNRERLYSLNYAFLGKKQYSGQEYRLPQDTSRIIMDASDFIAYQLQYSDKPEYRTGAARIVAYIRDFNLRIDSVHDSIVTFSKNGNPEIKLFEFIDTLPTDVRIASQPINQQLTLIGWNKKNYLDEKSGAQEIALMMYWRLSATVSENFDIMFSIKGGDGKKIYEKIFPFGYGLAPTFNWPDDKIVATYFWLSAPQMNSSITASVIDISGYLDLDGWRSAKTVFTKKNIVGPEIPL
ncbi:MAG: DUF2079 domain-containing protein [Patescibacteria group bacterium]